MASKKKVTKKRGKEIPTLVKVISVLYYIGAVAGLLIGLLLLFGAEFASSYIASLGEVGDIAGTIVITAGIIILIISVLVFFVARGLWKARNWARIVAIILSVLGVLGDIGAIAQGDVGSIISLIINTLIGGYLIFSKDVKKAFS